GKTYLAAFDFSENQPKKYLFIAHREELLTKDIEKFEKVTNDHDNFVLLTGSKKEWNKRFLFSSVLTLYKEETLKRFAPDVFDYIAIDEFLHAE
ncbi:DEAD/DEAH box helicase family protein, partial [Bacillus subtilis]|uniref:DEAD/DEAH box helicase family protein n=1 Tax=Bacillus subtilis TaxID=1423 RepID=UPI0024ADC370